MKEVGHSYLKRLEPTAYQGLAYVHWSMTIDDRKTGWLTGETHLKFRELQLHTLVRYQLVCPAYCLMPDHLHVFWIGLAVASDQLRAAQFFRQRYNAILKSEGCEFQEQAHDNVLTRTDRERDAVIRLAYYISENPVRASLVTHSRDWPYSGSQAVGYPDIDWRRDDFNEQFWKIYGIEARKHEHV